MSRNILMDSSNFATKIFKNSLSFDGFINGNLNIFSSTLFQLWALINLPCYFDAFCLTNCHCPSLTVVVECSLILRLSVIFSNHRLLLRFFARPVPTFPKKSMCRGRLTLAIQSPVFQRTSRVFCHLAIVLAVSSRQMLK